MIFITLIFQLFSLSASVDGFLSELKELNKPTKGCVSSTHTAFSSIQDFQDCYEGEEISEFVKLGIGIQDISRYGYLKKRALDYKKKLGRSYKNVFQLNQFLQKRITENNEINQKMDEIYQNFILLFEIHHQQTDEENLVKNLKCYDPRAGDWKTRFEICQKIKKNNSSALLESLKASIYADHPYLYHQMIKDLISLSPTPPSLSHFKEKFKLPMSDFTKNVAKEIAQTNDLVSNQDLLRKMSSPTPGPGSEVSSEDWAFLSRIMNDSEFKYKKGNEKFSYVDCLFHEDLINHEKLVGFDLFKKNVALSLLSVGMGAAAARFGTMAKVLSTLTPTAVGISVLDYPDIKAQKQKCDGLEKSMSLVEIDSKDWEKKEFEWKNCQTNLKIAFLSSALGPISDAVTLSGPALRSLQVPYNSQRWTERIARLGSPKEKTPSIKIGASIPAPKAPSKMAQLESYSDELRASLESQEGLIRKYQLSEDSAKIIIELRRQADKKVFQNITSSKYLDEDLTQRGYEQYSSIEDYRRNSPIGGGDPLSTTELMRQTKFYFRNIRNGEEVFEAMFKAMRDRGGMIEWHSAFYDDLLHRLLTSQNKSWKENFQKTGRFPREIVESAMLERASLYGWPSQFTDLDGGVLSSVDFGKKVASGKYLRERDLDEVSVEVAKKGVISDKGVEEKILKGELRHGELTHAAHMDYMLYLAKKGKLGPLKPEELRGFIQKLGEAMQFNQPGIQNAWSLLFDGTAQGKTLATPNNFYEIFSQSMEL